MTAFVVGGALAALALAFVLAPLLRGATVHRGSVGVPDLPPEASAIDALREIEFDQATGKLSADDYAALRAAYTPLALAELKARDAAADTEGSADTSAADGLDRAEALIARARARVRSCGACGPRPESDAVFCSDCGRFLGDACHTCGAAIGQGSARFCTACGASLAA